MEKIDLKAQWIWCEDNKRKNDFVLFKKTFPLESIPASAIAYIGVDTRYWLKVNGKSVVKEGGLLRESLPGCGYADEVELAPYLKAGRNTLEILAWFYGAGGRNNVNSGSGGLIFQCDALGLYSGKSFLCQRHPAYYTPTDSESSYLYGGGNVGFDNNKKTGKFTPATEYPNVWGDCYRRPIPLFRYGRPRQYKDKLPYAMWYIVSFEVEGKQGEKIRVYSDRYQVNGGPGDEMHTYKGYFHEFTLKDGLNRCATINPVFGEKIIFSKEVSHVQYVETGYDCDIIAQPPSSDRLLHSLITKAARTLYVCMRDNFMDCPDRERGQWIGDVSVQVPQVFHLLSDNARLLVKKAIYDFIHHRKGDVLVGNVPGENFSELPAQSLNAISEVGMIASYVKFSGDTSILKDCFLPMIRYLKLYDMGADGLVIQDFLEKRIQSIQKAFNQTFWKGTYYASGGFVDDRANALAVLSGLCPSENYGAVRSVLLKVCNASVYMENYVLTALCEMGYTEDAYRRMMSRYYNLAVNDNTTLWEDFFVLGTRNHAWSGAPATIAYQYLFHA